MQTQKQRLKAFLKSHNVHQWRLTRAALRVARAVRWSPSLQHLRRGREWLRMQQRRRLPAANPAHFGPAWYLRNPATGMGNLAAWRKRRHQTVAAPVIHHHYALWNEAREQRFIAQVADLYTATPARYDALSVSIIMPAYNRADCIDAAIDSVRAQNHGNWRLYVVDDGSSDATAARIRHHAAQDSRIEYIYQPHSGVSAARNAGLQAAKGEYVAYLDTDNRWQPDFLRHMLVAMHHHQLDAAYSGMVALDNHGKPRFYRGDNFDWQQCHQQNYVDMNCFMHRRVLAYPHSSIRFDESLPRFVDWDFILHLTASRTTCFLPFLGVEYDDSNRRERITHSHQNEADSLLDTIRARHQTLSAPLLQPDWGELDWLRTPRRIAIKVPAPRANKQEWGDYHYATSLAAAFGQWGHTVVIDCLEDWYKAPPERDEVVIVLRGLSRYMPNPQHFNILWNISHPDKVPPDEYAAYDIVYVASLSLADALQAQLGIPVAPLLQATDPTRFYPRRQDEQIMSDVLFVGNSRNEFRVMVRWALECNAPLTVYGTRWQQFIDPAFIAGENISNSELGRYYSGARVVLNDHWDSMRDNGILSNRIFDVLASGGRLISDPLPAISTLFGEDVVRQVNSAEEMRAALQESPRLTPQQVAHIAAYIHEKHSFSARARHILHDIYRLLGQQGLSPADSAWMAQPLEGFTPANPAMDEAA